MNFPVKLVFSIFFSLFLLNVALYAQPAASNKANTEKIENKPDVTAFFPGYQSWLQKNLHYPPKALDTHLEGDVILRVLIHANGLLDPDSIKVTKNLGLGCTEEAIRAIKSMPPWEPGIKDNKTVSSWLTISISFKLDKSASSSSEDVFSLNPTDTFEKIYEYTDVPAQYQGGQPAYDKYIEGSLIYPPYCIENKISGTVFVSMIVHAEGNISDIRIINGVRGTDEEVMRLIRSMPPWKPGKLKGENVSSRVFLTINFNYPDWKRRHKNIGKYGSRSRR
jgi:TonB family protein